MSISLSSKLLIFYSFFVSLNVLSQTCSESILEFQYLSIEHGLGTDETNFTYQDEEGFLWIGTNQGLFRYDGYAILALNQLVQDQNLSNLKFSDMVEGENYDMWFATSKGILCFNKMLNNLYFIEDNPRINENLSQSFSSIDYDSEGNIWFGGQQGLFSYDPEIKRTRKHKIETGNKNLEVPISDILIDSRGDIWVATWGQGLGYFDKNLQEVILHNIFDQGKYPSHYNILYSLYEDKQQNLWVGTWGNGAYILDVKNSGKPEILDRFDYDLKKEKRIVSTLIYDFEEDDFGNIWIAASGGVSIICDWRSSDSQILNINSSKEQNLLSHNEVIDISRDQSGIMWIATHGGGINKVSFKRDLLKTYEKNQIITGINKDNQDRLLLGVQGMGFGVYDIEKQSFKPYYEIDEYQGLGEPRINAVNNFVWDSNGILWLGTRYLGVIKYDPRTKKSHRIYGDNDPLKKVNELRTINKLVLDLDNNLWTISDGALYNIVQGDNNDFNDFVVRKVPIKFDLKDRFFEAIDLDIDRQGYLYIVMSNGSVVKSKTSIYKFSDELKFEFLFPSKKNHSFSAIYFDQNTLWLGGEKGIEAYELNHIEAASKSYLTEFRNLNIYSLKKVKNHIIALSNKGLVVLDLDKEKANILSEDEGLQGKIFLKGAFFEDKGEVFVGGHHGFNAIKVSDIPIDTSEPKVNFVNVKTAEQDVYSVNKFTDEIPFNVTYKNNAIRIAFAAADYKNSESLYYAYKMEGLEKKWNYISSQNRMATYVNLRPGRYNFLVKSTNSHGQWSTNQISLPIIVETAPYKTWWAYTIYMLLSMGILYSIFLLYKRQAKAKEDLRIESIEHNKSEKLNQFKLQFFTNISHELLTPLSILMAIAQKWRNNVSNDNKSEVKILKKNIYKLHEHINQMLHFRKAETGNMKLNFQRCSLNALMGEILESHQIIALDKEIKLKHKIKDDLVEELDKEKLEICINNLLSNAIKYTDNGGEVLLEAYKKDGRLYIKVSDTGRGIPKGSQTSIFNRFHRLSSTSQFEDGLGIGLALTKDLIDIQGGNIYVESEEGEGSSFEFYVPLDKKVAIENKGQLNNIFQSKPLDYFLQTENKEITATNEEKFLDKTILLVEDNNDFMVLMKNHLSGYYKVVTAENGNEALHLSNNNDIDLIVADLMMPIMDGKILCSKIKSDPNTSHIPFIILTARTADYDRISVYESGADSYLTKPINFEVLIQRINGLLKSREILYSDFNKGKFLEPKKIISTTIDQEFLTKAKSIVEDHISDPDLNVKVLCEGLAMSNSMLYRKIKGLLGLSPNEFIKNIRLRRAVQLLEDKEINISEVAHMTGFNDLSYFGVCFKKQYGDTPTNYQKKG